MMPDAARTLLPLVMFVAFGCVLVYFIVMSVILNYHWKNYMLRQAQLRKVRGWYYGVSAVLFAVAIGAMLSAL